MIKAYSSSRGGILLLSLIFMFVLITLATVFLQRVIATAKEAQHQVDRAQALYLAEAGINKAMYYLANTAPDGTTDGSWRTHGGYDPQSTDDDCAGGLACQENLVVAGATGTYKMWVIDGTANNRTFITIYSKGTINGVSRVLRSYVRYNSYLEARWKLDDGVGSVATDTGNDNTNQGHHMMIDTLSAIAYPLWVSSGCALATGKCLQAFVSSSSTSLISMNWDSVSYANIPTGSTNLVMASAGRAFSISGWMYITQLPGGDNSVGNLLTEHNYGYAFGYYQNTGAVYLYSCDWSGAVCTYGATSISLNAWHFYTAVFNPSISNKVTLYLDGTSDGTNTTVYPAGFSFNQIGSGHNGKIDDVRFYTRALSSSEVTTLNSFNGSNTDVTPWGYITVIPGYWKECPLSGSC